MTNKECKKKRQERCFIKQAMQACPSLFPSGELVKCERPDWLLKTGSETIGIEVTQLFQHSQKRGGFTPQSYDGDVKKVVCRAKELYHEMGGAPVGVNVNPTTFDGRRIDPDHMAESLACFVKKHYRYGQTVIFGRHCGITVNSGKQCNILTCETCHDRCIEIPEDFAEGSMFPPRRAPKTVGRISCCKSGREPLTVRCGEVRAVVSG